MIGIGVQTKDVVYDENPYEGFRMLKKAGFDCCDFSLNSYLKNTDIYQENINRFFDGSIEEITAFFTSHRNAAAEAGIKINQMHMPYPIFVPSAAKEVNDYLLNQVAIKSMEVCHFLKCPYIVIHGYKLARYLGSEELEWERTAAFLDKILPPAKKYGITVCIENLYEAVADHIVEGPCCNVHKAVQRIDDFNERYGAEVLGFCFDTGHANLVGIDFEKFLTALGNRLKVLHLHDNDGRADLHQIPYTFTRTRENTASTEWEGLIRGLKTISFEGALSFETAPVLTSFPDFMKQDVLTLIAAIGRGWKQEIER